MSAPRGVWPFGRGGGPGSARKVEAVKLPTPKFAAVGAGAVLALVASGIVLTHAIGGTTSTTTLDQFSTVKVDGKPALSGSIVAGRIMSKYHPLPWVGSKLSDASCPTGLEARVGASITCTGSSASGARITIPVHVTAISGDAVTWSFDR